MPHTRGVRSAGARDIECGAMVRAGTDERQTYGDVDAILNTRQLDRDQPLIMVLGYDNVIVTPSREHENGITRMGAARVDPLLSCCPVGESDDVEVFTAEEASLAGVRIQAGHRDAGRGDSEFAQRLIGESDGAQFRVDGEAID